MRVHPTLLVSSQFNWKWPSLAVACLSLAALGFPRQESSMKLRETLVPAVIVKQTLHPGSKITARDIHVELRPVSTLPVGVVKAPGAALGKTLTSAVPAQSILSQVYFEVEQDQSTKTASSTNE